MCGMVPFGEQVNNPYEIYEEIIKKQIFYPNYLKDQSARSLMQRLLNKSPDKRFFGSFKALKNDLWFKNFNWVFLFP